MPDLVEASIEAFRSTSDRGVPSQGSASEALAARLGLTQPAPVVAAAQIAVPLLVDAMRRRLTEPDGDPQLASIIAGTDPSGLVDPTAGFSSGTYARHGLRIVDHLFDNADSRGRAARTVTDRAGLAPGTGAEVLTAAAWVIGAHLHNRVGSPVDSPALLAAIDGTTRRPKPPAPTIALAPVISEPDDGPLFGTQRARPPQRAASPELHKTPFEAASRPTRSPVSPPGPTSQPPSAVGSGPASRPPAIVRPQSVTPPQATSDLWSKETIAATAARPKPRAGVAADHDDDDAGASRLFTGGVALLGLLMVAGAAFWWLNRDGGDATSVTSAEQGPAGEGIGEEATTDEQDDATQDDGTSGDATQDDVTSGDGDGEQYESSGDPSAPSAEYPSSIDVVMIDPVGRSTATGTAALRFDRTVGEVCYDISLDGVDTPADGHIHLGPAGVKGGIIVDFGPMEDNASGCHPVPPTEVDAILGDLDGHYVELHDPSDEFTIRAQLSEGTGADGQPAAPDASDAPAPDDMALFDPDGGGATAIVQPDRIVLRGEVSDRETAERVLIDFAGLSDVVVIDELSIVDGSPLPSGRVIIEGPESGLFATNSDQLDPGVDLLVEQLVGLLDARPDWLITVVGHTDSTGDEVTNLELSFRRAEAVRQELVDGGIDAGRIRVRGAGSTDPLGNNATEAGRAENRRIEFEIER